MADKFCDHGAYSAGSLTGSISGTTLTVTAVSQGFVYLGANISGTGIAAGTMVSALIAPGSGGGVGGVGTYTVSLSQTAASTAITSQYASPKPIPDWGVPQEGDGTSSLAAIASAVSSVDLTNTSAAAGNTFSLLGSAAITCVASAAGVNQFNAGSAAALATSLAAAINRANNTVTTAAPVAGWSTPLVQNAVYARATGALLEIMTRAGSAGYNGVVAMMTVGFTGWPANPTFANGSGGCWGHLVNLTAPIWPSNIAISSYGPHIGNHLAGFAGSAAAGGESIKARSNKTIRCGSQNFAFGSVNVLQSSQDRPLLVEIDDSVVWADPANSQLLIYMNTSGGSYNVFANIATPVHFKGKQRADGTCNWKFVPLNTTTAVVFSLFMPAYVFVEGVELDCSAITGGGSGNVTFPYQGGTSYGAAGRSRDCVLRSRVAQAMLVTATSVGSIEVLNLTLDATGAGTQFSRILSLNSVHGNGLELIFEGLKFIGFPENSRLFDPTDVASSNPLLVTFSNTSWGGVVGHGPVMSAASSQRNGRYVQSYQSHGSMDGHLDIPAGYFDWDPAGGYPKCNAKLLDGTTQWVWKVIPARSNANISRFTPLELPRIVKYNTFADGVRTVRVEAAVHKDVTLTASDMTLVLIYQHPDGSIKTFDSYVTTSAALLPSDAIWSSELNGQVLLPTGAVLHNKVYLTATTPTAVKANTQVNIYVRFHKFVVDATKTIFVDPEAAMT